MATHTHSDAILSAAADAADAADENGAHADRHSRLHACARKSAPSPPREPPVLPAQQGPRIHRQAASSAMTAS